MKKQETLLNAAKKAVTNKKLTIRKAAHSYGVPYAILHRRINLCSAAWPERPTFLTAEEEGEIVKACLHFSDNGTLLELDGIRELIQLFVSRLPSDRFAKSPFKNGRPGPTFMRAFIKRHSEHVCMRRRAALEKPRQMAMTPTNLASHFARLVQVYAEYSIRSPCQVFNVNESGFSTRTAARARAKALMLVGGRSNATELAWSSNADHLTIMTVVAADSTVYNPVVILPGARTSSAPARIPFYRMKRCVRPPLAI